MERNINVGIKRFFFFFFFELYKWSGCGGWKAQKKTILEQKKKKKSIPIQTKRKKIKYMEHKRIGSTLLLDNPFEWSNDSSLEFFANAIDADEEEDTAGSSRTSVKRDRITAAKTLHRDYFCEEPRYNDQVFEDTYRMRKSLFLKITHAIESRFEYFQEGYDARAKKSFTTI